MDTWVLVFARHLNEEIGLTVENVNGFEKKKSDEMQAAVMKHVRSLDPGWALCSNLGGCGSQVQGQNSDSVNLEAMMPMAAADDTMHLPGFVKKLLVPARLQHTFRRLVG